MLRSALPALFVYLVFAAGFAVPNPSADASESPPVFVPPPSHLTESKKRLQAGDPTFLAALNRLTRDAERALKSPTFSVTHKDLLPPSGDKHDYMSLAPYRWPNPNTTHGLPYVRRDGEINPERDRTSDRKRLDQLVQAVKTLGLAHYFTGREEYAVHAAKRLRVWFFDEATKMNPHLRYAQAVPGRNTGRPEGIIETHNLPELIDAVGLLQGSNGWTETDHIRLRGWFNSMLNWLRDSPESKAEAKSRNNHGTWYDVQVASFALFVEREKVAKQLLAEFAARRIAKQIELDGSQPQELARTQAWHYSIFNLEALFNAAAPADKVGIDLWNYETNDKRSIRKALDWLIPFAAGEKKWTYKEISPFEPQKLAPLLRRAAIVYREPAYDEAIAKLPKPTGDERWQLFYPRPAQQR
jgi:hypothetical protein